MGSCDENAYIVSNNVSSERNRTAGGRRRFTLNCWSKLFLAVKSNDVTSDTGN